MNIMSTPRNRKFVLRFNELGIKDVPLVGGKNASLGEMFSGLSKKGIMVPDGFAVTASAYRYFLKAAGIKKEIERILKDLDTSNIVNLKVHGQAVRNLILSAQLPVDLEKEIIGAYRQLSGKKDISVAVRSSATAEDLPDASFAGQQETYLHITGGQAVLAAVKRCISSLFTDRAISYRVDKNFDHFKLALSVGVQKMVRSDKGVSGVMFTADTESGFKETLVINGSYGLGEYVVKGAVTPDEFRVFQTTLKMGFPAIISKKLGTKEIKLVYSGSAAKPTKQEKVSESDRNKLCLSDGDILQLAKWGVTIEEHYKKSMDVEWVKDGLTGELYIVQARPETVHFTAKQNILEEYYLKVKESEKKLLIKGISVGNKIGAGRARVILAAKNMKEFQTGEVLVTDVTDPDWEPIMKIAGAIITNQGGRTCHAAIVSRELGIPCVVGTGTATQKIETGAAVTVSCAEGQDGYVYEGVLPFAVKKINLQNIPRPKTKIMMNVGIPENAFAQSFIPNDGVGLAREEFIINSYIKIHPNAILKFNQLKDEKAKRMILKMTTGYKNKRQFFVDKLAEGIGQIAAAFYPKDVIVRLSDFKTNEYAELIGGRQFEPTEANPMIGWRGASRYYSSGFKDAFGLECEAIKKAREKMGLDNVIVMVPFCRTVEEAKLVLQTMADNKLQRGERVRVKIKKGVGKTKEYKLKALQVYVMTEIPANVILIDEFAKYFDGFSIGSNDLTQLTLGLDRDAGTLSFIGNEKNEAVKRLIAAAITGAKKNKRKIGICGQGPSDLPDFAEFLVREGVDSISLNSDTVIKTTIAIGKLEKRMRK
ncbi:phosphoenolpyruvate synthase [Candidatus Kuenenbacteria bacterium RIFCSPLOWO2_12_FULL_42_13]|uniref:Phosphoenolpyruvate synthase n=3 Tax=Candidatus Kueneniibacteriota TaxID=1752740 RepID=A0A1F6FZP4_9BACT|nr:MAG: phosphoenolpyruvate synthase [Candidatus Kuenenbacteria bacterium RIFCSPHIGHO2_02_FULL_42_29]OGG91005.1 MAG: phosphoenolpyruvate synthase [Candidatus Kuenenbacteria bacterium RIFCSPLOWO2_02_FULL_42_16]OGG91340.1 MAG: phosphoenolpyruvate synthase [Candidatus Kuenenbacteria bacterium RIFCSPLOWO2_12_FULL_42_13]OGH01200.1 MAG: phosphoenolpyruvate synthase [Candidatus Kuenenbacteria bacterium RIFCSPHIGHO2_12_FULL_42_14]